MIYKNQPLLFFIFLINTALFSQNQNIDTTQGAYLARVQFENKDLEGVSWEQIPGLETTGVFHTDINILTPVKRGYYFTPDVFHFGREPRKYAKVFKAHKNKLSDGLVYHIPLVNDFENKVNADDQYYTEEVNIVQDPIKGSVACFNGRNSFLEFKNWNENIKELTLSVWIKPLEQNRPMGIIGKGMEFSAKISKGELIFTTPGIKDHVTNKMKIPFNEWTHLSFVYIPQDYLYFYINGTLIDKIPASDYLHTGHDTIIGSNIWGEYFKGYMRDFLVWDRALSDEEINTIFKGAGHRHSPDYSYYFWWTLSILLISFFPVLIRKKHKKASISIPIEKTRTPKGFPSNSIQVLGKFKIYNTAAEEVGHLLPPKRKELFLLILIKTIIEEGVSTQEISEYIWPNFSKENAKNNRSTQIKELRGFLKLNLPIQIIYDQKMWKIDSLEQISVDLKTLIDFDKGLFQNQETINPEQNLRSILSFLKRGPLLVNCNTPALDNYKAEFTNHYLKVLTEYIDSSAMKETAILEILEVLLKLDSTYEYAVSAKISLLIKQGKHKSAQEYYKSYRNEYRILFGQTDDIQQFEDLF